MTPASPSAPSPARVSAWLAGVFLLCFVYFLPRMFQWSAVSHLDTTMAIVNHGTVAIDPYSWNNRDEAYYGGHYYSNKAPGLSLVAVPVYAAHKALFELVGNHALSGSVGLPTRSLDEYLRFILAEYLVTVYAVAAPSVLLLLLFFWFLGFFSTSLANRAVLTLALGLGTSILPYSQNFDAHVPVAALLFTGFVLVYLLGRGPVGAGGWTHWIHRHERVTASLAGLALGLAVLCAYEAAVISGLLAVYAAVRLPRRLLWYLAAGAAPPLAALLAYGFAVYHNPLATGYGKYSIPYWRHGLHGSTASSWGIRANALRGLAIDRSKGLFFLSPWLALAVPGYLLWARRCEHLWLLFLAISVAFYIAISTFSGWEGGAAVGPRYLIPMLPFLALPVIFVLDRASPLLRLGIYGVMAVSVAAVWIETVGGTTYLYSGQLPDPLFTYSIPEFFHGHLSLSIPTLLMHQLVGANAPVTLLPFAVLLAVWTGLLWVPVMVGRQGGVENYRLGAEPPV